MNKQFKKLKSVTPIGVNYSYDFAVENSHRIIARKTGTNSAFYTSNCWHPDVRDFIKAKQTAGVLTKFNISVGITSGFMKAVENNLDWNLRFPDTDFERYDDEWDGDIEKWERNKYPVIVYETVKAVDLWNEITYSTYMRNEPGVLFLDLANEMNPLNYNEKIFTSNPCVVGDTLVKTDKGEFEMTDIVRRFEAGENFNVLTFNVLFQKFELEKILMAGKTKENAEIYELELEDGTKLQLTSDHKVWTQNRGYIEVKDLTEDDEIVGHV